MKTTRAIKMLCSAVPLLLLQGCFFFFIPGSVIDRASDSMTGAEGQNCVSVNAKIGDSVRLPNGQMGTIKSLSGETTRCKNPALPIRALVEVTA